MPYKTIIRERASKEYLEAIAWYEQRSLQAAENKKYPYNIIYFIDAEKQSVIITTLFHHKRNPKKKFK